MSETPHPIVQLLRDDPRYKLEAYEFVRDALAYAQEVLEMGQQQTSEPSAGEMEELEESLTGEETPRVERHLTGQQLCEAIRQYALQQYGYMATVVLARWGVTSTSDFGEIVYNLIRIGLMKKSEHDRREDFDNVYDFQEALKTDYRITPTE